MPAPRQMQQVHTAIAGLSTIAQEHASILATPGIKKPTLDPQLSLLLWSFAMHPQMNQQLTPLTVELERLGPIAWCCADLYSAESRLYV